MSDPSFIDPRIAAAAPATIDYDRQTADARWDLPPAEAAGLAAIQHAVSAALGGYFRRPDLDWITEEVLWQIRARLRRTGCVELPGIGAIELQRIDAGVAIVATASADLQR